MGGIFISYRGDDSEAWTRGIWERLVGEFGQDPALMNVRLSAPGEDVVGLIDRYVGWVALRWTRG